MKILMLSTDLKIFESGSESEKRIKDYGSLVEELHVIVKAASDSSTSLGAGKQQAASIIGNVFLYPTNDRHKFLYFFNAYRIGKSIIRNWKLEIRNCVITAQDPFETGLVGYWLKRKYKPPLQLQVHTDFLSPYFLRKSILTAPVLNLSIS